MAGTTPNPLRNRWIFVRFFANLADLYGMPVII